jgi:DNA-binding CsgD family transcriptional regulator
VDSARELTEQIRACVVRTIDVLGEIDALVVRAYEGRAWVVLGHDSWEAYCAAEFSDSRLWQSVAQRQAATLRLREAGLSERAVAAVLGVGKGTVGRDVESVSTAPTGAVDTAVGLDGRERPARRQDSAQVRRRSATVVALRSQGCTQVEIAAQLGIAQSTVSTCLAMATARGELDPVAVLGVPEPRPPVDDTSVETSTVPAPSRAGALIAEAAARAAALSTHVRALRETVVDADEWTSDVLLAADVADVVSTPLAEVAGELEYVLAHLDESPSRLHVPPSARSHVLRARRVRQIARALASGQSTPQVAAGLGIDVDVVVRVDSEVAALPADRRPGAGGHQVSGG